MKLAKIVIIVLEVFGIVVLSGLGISNTPSALAAGKTQAEPIAVENSAVYLSDPNYFWGEKASTIFSYSDDALKQISSKALSMISINYCFMASPEEDKIEIPEGYRDGGGASLDDLFSRNVDSTKKNTLVKVVRVPTLDHIDCAKYWFVYKSEPIPQ